MTPLALLALIPALTTSVFAADLGKLIFQDDFSRNESQETSDDPGNGWGTNSKSRVMGDRQVERATPRAVISAGTQPRLV